MINDKFNQCFGVQIILQRMLLLIMSGIAFPVQAEVESQDPHPTQIQASTEVKELNAEITEIIAEPVKTNDQKPIQLTPEAVTPPDSTIPPLPEVCNGGHWKLTGADFTSGIEVTYQQEWTPTLKQVALCLNHKHLKQKCLEIQGQYDDIPFSEEIIAAVGSLETAQSARAMGRATAVVTKLSELGVPINRLQVIAPPIQPSFRGVGLTLIDDCVDMVDDDYTSLIAKELEKLRAEQSEKYCSKVVVEDLALSIASQLKKHEHTKPIPGPGPMPSKHHFWLSAGIDFNLWVVSPTDSPSTFFSSVFRIGAGWQNELLYARLATGASVGIEASQRVGLDMGGAVGYYHQKWLQIGAVGGFRLTTTTPTKPWLEQIWYLGLEGTHCLVEFSGNEVCVREAVGPFGGLLTRAEVVDGQIEQIKDDYRSLLRFDLGVLVRHNLL